MRAAWALAFLLAGLDAAGAETRLAEFERATHTLLERFRERDGFPGARAAFVLADDRLGEAAVGLSDDERGLLMTTDRRFMSGSVGKSFVAAVALSLAREGRLDLDAPIATWLGDEPWFARLPNGPAITTRLLLKHAAGLEDHVHTVEFWLRALWQRLTRGPDARLPPHALVDLILDEDALFAPGAGYHYTDTGYILIGLILERATGRSYYDLLRERFLAPLDLVDTFPADRRDLPGLAAGYQRKVRFLASRLVDGEGRLLFHPGVEWTGGGLVTNPRDLARWAKALYEERAMKKPYLEEMLAVPSAVRAGVAYGLGVFIWTSTPLGVAYGHGGWFPGYRTQMMYFPALRLAVAVQINTDGGADPREYAIAVGEELRRSETCEAAE